MFTLNSSPLNTQSLNGLGDYEFTSDYALNTTELNLLPLTGGINTAGDYVDVNAVKGFVELGVNNVIAIPATVSGEVITGTYVFITSIRPLVFGDFQINSINLTSLPPFITGKIENDLIDITAPPAIVSIISTEIFLSDVAITANKATLDGKLAFSPTIKCSAIPARISGQIITGGSSSLNLVVHKAELVGYGNEFLEVTATQAKCKIDVLSGTVGNVGLIAKAVIFSGDISQSLFVDFVAIPAVVAGNILNCSLGVVAVASKKGLVEGRLCSGTLSSVLINPRQADVFVSILQEGLLVLDLLAPLSQVKIALFSDLNTGDAQTYSMCLDNLSITEYTNFNFHSLVNFNGQVLGADENGLYLLSGDSDNGSEIPAELLTGSSDLEVTNLKRASDIYFKGVLPRASMEGIFKTFNKTVTVSLVRSKNFNESYRAKIPRGLKWRKIQIGCRNKNGVNFELDGLELLIQKLNRKVL